MRRFISILALLTLLSPAAAGAQPYTHHRSSHIDLIAPEGASISGLSDELERAYRDVRAYGLMLPASIEVRCYRTTTEFTQGSGGGRLNLAMAVGERVHLQPIGVLLRRQEEYARSLRHELTHVALAKSARNGLPRWLNEGMAMTVAGESPPVTTVLTSLPQLEKALISRSYTTQRNAYAVARRLCDRLIAGYGKARLLGMVTGAGFGSAFRAMTGKDVRVWCEGELRKIR